ncbi:Smc5 [Drosophila busckii]|uniref:Structural maintenance of chromosomes protein 5 n=2 Tax=Drosophila busckii TaxID=30019 RepID=A0A0M4F0J9_DROBS|nr:Smc5 [Drosophila busckii]
MVGRIKSVYCKDFVSYNEITFYPREYLNVLTGPNGTGKSTIVSAIILGLGGEPQLLDRSSSISDYIKSNKASAIIVVTIYGKEKNSIETFKRTINNNGESRYYVNDKDLTKSKYLATIASYKIQVNNLCQFLPQDRVQDFSKMNAQQLLVNTMSSVCDNQLMKSFNDLKEMRTKHLKAHSDRDKEKDAFQKEQKRLDQLQVSLGQYQERQAIQEKLKIYHAKKLWTEVGTIKTKADEMKSRLTSVKVDCVVRKTKYDNEKRNQDEYLRMSTTLRKNTLENIREINTASDTKKKLAFELESVKQKINVSKYEMETTVQEAKKGIGEVENVLQLVEAKENELREFNKLKPELLIELEVKRKSIYDVKNSAMSLFNKRKEIESKINDEQIPEITALNHKIERLQNIKTQKLEELRQRNPNLVKAMNWVAQNKHNYKQKIYDPMLFELSMKSEESAMYLENVIRQSDLHAFACEDKEDMSDLINELSVKQKLCVNIIYCEPTDRCTFRPIVPIADIAHMGFKSYLLDLVSGPMTLINKLCGTYHIHNIPIGGDEVSNFTSQIPKSIRLYFGGTKKFSSAASRYRSDLLLTESTIHGKNQLICQHPKQLMMLRERHAKSVNEKDQLKNNLGRIDSEFERLQIILRDEGDKKKKVEQKLGYYDNIQKDVKKLMEKANNLKNSFVSIETIKDKFKATVLLDIKNILKIESDLIKILEATDILISDKKNNQAIEMVHQQQHSEQIDMLKESEEAYKEAQISINRLESQLQNQLQAIKSKAQEVKKLCNGELPMSNNFPFKAEFEELVNTSIEQINDAIVEFQARLECMKNVNPEALNEYRQTEAIVEELRKSIEEKSNQERNVESEITALFNEWEPKLIKLIDTISGKFSEFMESISYVGEVILTRKDKLDFDSYGIQIMVQYRKDAKLQALDKYIQSGGERAVAIAIYSLSLQHVTHVPFRCVDEINQGMDAKNERHIFDLLLKEATKHGSAQYLFVTPKLLRDLNYNEHLCVLVVHNSASIKKGAHFSLCSK